ncbi:hypothetical protein [Alteromonas sp. 14N.309.X.WAT.G.H12]|uniref:hypothetical protein n=1 Tax=Alteromonas sp. 14N.309.X.WAT.G.H12 TaxID=3120824 RepID=UPI002FD4ADF4
MKNLLSILLFLMSFSVLGGCFITPEDYKPPTISEKEWVSVSEENKSFSFVAKIPVREDLSSLVMVTYSADKENQSFFVPLSLYEQDEMHVSFFTLPESLAQTSSLVAQFGDCGSLIEWQLKDYLDK